MVHTHTQTSLIMQRACTSRFFVGARRGRSGARQAHNAWPSAQGNHETTGCVSRGAQGDLTHSAEGSRWHPHAKHVRAMLKGEHTGATAIITTLGTTTPRFTARPVLWRPIVSRCCQGAGYQRRYVHPVCRYQSVPSTRIPALIDPAASIAAHIPNKRVGGASTTGLYPRLYVGGIVLVFWAFFRIRACRLSRPSQSSWP